MRVPDRLSNSDILPSPASAPVICRRCGRQLASSHQRVLSECEAYCQACYRRLMFPDLREADTESLD